MIPSFMMELRRKLEVLADAAKYDASCASSGSKRERVDGGIGNTEGMGICHSYTPDGRCISLLKLLLTNVCIWDCSYCINRKSSNIPRARFKPEEVVRLTMNFYKRNYIEGLFLSSGIIQSADYTMEQLILVAKKLRLEEKFGGYIHLKAVPGASKDLLLEAGKYADRLSANIEMPVQEDLDTLAPEKTISEIENTMADVKYGLDDAKDRGVRQDFARAGQSTQLVVGASASTDTTILTKAEALYKKFLLRRVYYSAFSPAEHTDVTLHKEKAPAMREHRLYEADWLIRNYGFAAHEVTQGLDGGNLDLDHDPKLAWALRHRSLFPVDVNRASKSLLMRIPGIGIRNVDRILKIRRFQKVRLEDLARLRVSLSRAKWFIITADHNPDVFKLDRASLPDALRKRAVQPELFAALSVVTSAVTGEL
ncbi:MAG TPA: putative DNA modification/repair radical SAM protein [Pyrinomonadaceae bacterium]|nr:putative DNA modification/repair radical SAM protein [Pyrinomonadaceae bacterium]